MRSSSWLAFIFLAAASVGLAWQHPAEACGGTFCDTGPRQMPVDQTGENIVFVMGPGKVEAHIQIQYKGEAAKFSWILPVQALPEVEVGSQAFFDRLLQATVPTYGTSTQFDFCGTGPGATGTGGGTFADASAPPRAAVDAGVSVVFQKPVGAFEITVLQGGTSTEVVDWLTQNLYQVPPNASALLEDYVARNYLFVAVKLTGGADINEIHPLVVRFNSNKPCVPLKLTAVAAAEDMGVRTFFLGTRRVVPQNYKHVVPNLVKFDWFNATTTYQNLVGRAVDSPIANGKAFITEYAGPTAVVGARPIAASSWSAVPFATSAAVGVIQLLQSQGLVSCLSNRCSYAHPLLLPLLRQYLPPPATLTVNGSIIVDPVAIEGYFYSCLACYQDTIDQTQWNGPEFASGLATRIIDPARHADALLGAWPYLTRMFTTISPVEMTEDPEFQERDGLPTMGVIRSSAVQRITCSGSAGVKLPDGRDVALPSRQVWPRFSDDMPWAERIEEIPAAGDPIVLVNNTERINAQLKAWNDSQQWPPPGAGGSPTTVGPGSGSTTSTGTGTGGGTAGAGQGEAGAGASATSSGCGCRSASAPPSLGGIAALGAFLICGARRRSSSRAAAPRER